MKNKIKEDELKNNIVVLTGFEFVEQRPFGFFNFKESTDKDKVFKKKIIGNYEGQLRVEEYGFEPVLDNGVFRSEEVCIVSRAKPRRVLIFQDIDFCKQYHDNVFIIPIQSACEPIKENYSDTSVFNEDYAYFQKLIKKDESIYNEYYFPVIEKNKPIKHRKLVLSDARFVHKSSLIDTKEETGLSKKDLKEVGKRIIKMLNIDTKADCDSCKYYEMYESFKKIMGRIERLEKNS